MSPATLQDLAASRGQDLRRTAMAARRAKLARRARRGGNGPAFGRF
jgi:hypothetical protein